MSVALWQASVARSEAARATTIKDFVLSIIQQADPVASRQTREADIAMLATAESRIERELESQPELALQMRRAIGEAYATAASTDAPGKCSARASSRRALALPPDNLELLGAFVQMADEYVIDSREAKADLESGDHTFANPRTRRRSRCSLTR